MCVNSDHQVEKQLKYAYKAAEVNYKRSQLLQHQNTVNETIYRKSEAIISQQFSLNFYILKQVGLN